VLDPVADISKSQILGTFPVSGVQTQPSGEGHVGIALYDTVAATSECGSWPSYDLFMAWVCDVRCN
jgi:hypothetical protein